MADRDEVISLDSGTEDGTVSLEALQRMKESMSSEANKAIRDAYRSLLTDQQEKVDQAGTAGLEISDVKQMVLKANSQIGHVQRPREAALDAEFLSVCGKLMKTNIQEKQFNSLEFHPGEFSVHMKNFMKGEDETEVELQDSTCWRRFGKAVSSIYKTASSVESIYPGIDLVKPPKKVREARRKVNNEVGAVVVPKKISEPTNDEERQTEEINRVFRILKRCYVENGRNPVCFYSFVVNPMSYTYTIENIFHTSFLVNMLRAELLEDEDGMPTIAPLDSNANRNGDASTSQLCVSLSVEEHKEIVEVFKIKDSSIPPPQNARKRH